MSNRLHWILGKARGMTQLAEESFQLGSTGAKTAGTRVELGFRGELGLSPASAHKQHETLHTHAPSASYKMALVHPPIQLHHFLLRRSQHLHFQL